MKRYESVKLDDIKPYADNAKIHPQRQIDRIRASIREFGFINPIILDSHYEIIAGHGRLEAARQEGMEAVPCLFVEDLEPDQIRAFRLIDNKLAEESAWSVPELNKELADLTVAFNMPAFGFNLPSLDLIKSDEKGIGAVKTDEEGFEVEPVDYKWIMQDKVNNILNLGLAHYDGVGHFDIPEILPVYEAGPVDDWIGFNYMLSEPEPENKGLHFFVDDYQFERIWNAPQRYLEKLARFKVVLSPDFSPYGNMPFVMQAWNHYRKHWLAAYWQDSGVHVVPTIRASTDPRSFDFFLEGEPHGGIVCISSMWAHIAMEELQEEFRRMMEGLEPVKVFVYGDLFGWMEEYGVPLERIETFAEKRFKKED